MREDSEKRESDSRMKNDYQPYSVLMSVYAKEKSEYLRLSMQSMWEQTVPTNDFVLVCDGPLTEDLNKVIADMEQEHQAVLNVIRLDKNQGLGIALAEGILHCKNELVARMDSDDISRKDRCEIELQKFAENPNLDICGSHIIEFDGTIDNELSRRKVKLNHNDIVKFQKTRTAFNHMTVMYKKSKVIAAENYQDCPLIEDSYLWVRMIIHGAYCANIDDYLVYARTGKEMIARRGGWSYLKKYIAGRKKILNTGFINYWEYLETVIAQIVVAFVPSKIRFLIFQKTLRG